MRLLYFSFVAVLNLVTNTCPLLAKPVYFEFKRSTIEDGSTESISGRMILLDGVRPSERQVFLHVLNPVNQIIAYQGTQSTVYYPLEKKGFVFKSKADKLDMLQPATKTLDLRHLGFNLLQSRRVEGNVEETWSPQNLAKSPFKDFVIRRDSKGRLLKLEAHDKEGGIMMRMIYGNFFELPGRSMPMQMESYTRGFKGNTYEERMLLRPSSRDSSDELAEHFEIPKDATMKTVETP